MILTLTVTLLVEKSEPVTLKSDMVTFLINAVTFEIDAVLMCN